jgi:hypothetical protein
LGIGSNAGAEARTERPGSPQIRGCLRLVVI